MECGQKEWNCVSKTGQIAHIKYKHRVLEAMPHNVYTGLYDSIVAPIIQYSVCLLGTKEYAYSCINAIQNRACRLFLGVQNKYAANPAVNCEKGWKSNKFSIDKKKIKK